MSVYDNLILHKDVQLNQYPFRSTRRENGYYRKWQTKDLNPSLDTYAVIPKSYFNEKSNNKDILFRRHPPEIKWTFTNEGNIDTNKNLIDSADHWRSIRYTGTTEISNMSKDGCIYRFECEFDNGILKETRLKERTTGPDMYIPEPPYSDSLDLNCDVPELKNTDYNICDIQNIVYNKQNIQKLLDEGITYNQIYLALNYYNIKYI